MAQLSVLDERTEKNTRLAEPRDFSAAERQHAKDIEIYRKMLYEGFSEADLMDPATVSEPKEEAPAETSAAKRLADYKAYSAHTGHKTLFEGISYKDGELIQEAPVSTIASATVTMPASAPVSAPIDEDDAVPTRRTMETLRRSVAAQVEAQQDSKTSVFASVSAKTKIVLAAIACAILMAIVLICINTGIINGIDANIEATRLKAQEQKQYYEELAKQLSDMEDPEGEWSQFVEDYANRHNMTRG